MTATEQLIAQRDAEGTGWVDIFKTGAIGSVLFFAPQMPMGLEKYLTAQSVEYRQVDDTQQATNIGTEVDEFALRDQLARVYNYLSLEQVELDVESREVLYTNLWSMYE